MQRTGHELPDPMELLYKGENQKEMQRIYDRYKNRPKQLNREVKKFVKRVTREWQKEQIQANYELMKEDESLLASAEAHNSLQPLNFDPNDHKVLHEPENLDK